MTTMIFHVTLNFLKKSEKKQKQNKTNKNPNILSLGRLWTEPNWITYSKRNCLGQRSSKLAYWNFFSRQQNVPVKFILEGTDFRLIYGRRVQWLSIDSAILRLICCSRVCHLNLINKLTGNSTIYYRKIYNCMKRAQSLRATTQQWKCHQKKEKGICQCLTTAELIFYNSAAYYRFQALTRHEKGVLQRRGGRTITDTLPGRGGGYSPIWAI